MFDREDLYAALASAGVSTVAAPQPTPAARSALSSIPHVSSARIQKPRKPKVGCNYTPSPFRPPVLARHRIRCWTSPHSASHQNSILSAVPLSEAQNLLDVMLHSLDIKTQECYAAGLLRFTQYCDRLSIPEASRVPAAEPLLAAFVASWAGKISSSTTDNWLSGLRFWHEFQGAPWRGGNLLRITKSGVEKMTPASSKRDKRPPVTIQHMHCLATSLDKSNPRDAAILAAGSSGFWGACRLGELVPPSDSLFDPEIHVANDVEFVYGTTDNGIEHASFHVPKTKTDANGANICLTTIDDPTTPLPFIKNHLAVNADVPRGAPLFAYLTVNGGWEALTKPRMLNRCNEVWRVAGLPELPGHAFRIGGCTELLLRGTNPDVVMVQGRWKSKAFLEYWRRIDSILPLFLTNSFQASRVALVQNTMNIYSRRQTH